MTRRPRVLAVALLAGLLVLVAPALVRPADAAPSWGTGAGAAAAPVAAPAPPLLPTDQLIPLVQQLAPVLEIVSPIVWPQCANALLVNVLPGALGIPVPPELSVVTGPLLVLCGAVPIPGTNTRTCALDAQAQALLAQLTTPVLGSGLPIEVAPTKWITGLLDNIVDLIAQPAIPKGSVVAATLQCTDPGPETTTTVTAPTTSAPSDLGALPVDDLQPPTFDELQTLPPVEPSLVAAPAAPAAPVAPVVQLISQPRFRYPVVMAMPLVFLALLVFFGRALTRPLVLATERRVGPPAAPEEGR